MTPTSSRESSDGQGHEGDLAVRAGGARGFRAAAAGGRAHRGRVAPGGLPGERYRHGGAAHWGWRRRSVPSKSRSEARIGADSSS